MHDYYRILPDVRGCWNKL